MNSSTFNPLDVSELLFHQTDSTNPITPVNDGLNKNTSSIPNEHQPTFYVGPISIIHQPATAKNSNNHTTISKGRCLVANRALDVGELLFVTPPIVDANVHAVWEEYTRRRSISKNDDNTSLAEVAEYVLLNACQDAITKQNHGVIHCLTALERRQRTVNDETDSIDDDTTSVPNTCQIHRLLGQTDTNVDDNHDTSNAMIKSLSDDDIIQIIRRNAFGSDFPTTNRIEQRWCDALENTNENSSIRPSTFLPSRLLGIYGLAAMINHSCIPNAVRVFSGNDGTMIVHACQPIQEGEEIVWSYIPVVQTYLERQLLLQQTHNFTCQCPRCCSESTLLHSSNSLLHNQLRELEPCITDSRSTVADVVHRLEHEILNQSTLSNELKRYIRISYMQIYMTYMNETLSSIILMQNDDSKDNVAALQKLLTLAFQIHLTFVVCHNVSTEHLSVRFSYLCQTSYLFKSTDGCSRTQTLHSLHDSYVSDFAFVLRSSMYDTFQNIVAQ